MSTQVIAYEFQKNGTHNGGNYISSTSTSIASFINTSEAYEIKITDTWDVLLIHVVKNKIYYSISQHMMNEITTLLVDFNSGVKIPLLIRRS